MAKSTLQKTFVTAFGKPKPRAKPMRFPHETMQTLWEFIHREIGAGYFRDGFLYLFGEYVDELAPCLEAWSFLLPPMKQPVVLGHNAYGALLVMPDTTKDNPRIGILDPNRVSWNHHADLDLGGLLGAWLPAGMLRTFTDDAHYRALRARGLDRLPEGVILAPKTAIALGGDDDVDNLWPQEIVTYYEVTGPVYRKHGPKKKRRRR
jgi:hypothetical protein